MKTIEELAREREYRTISYLTSALANIFNASPNKIIDLLTGYLWDEEDAVLIKIANMPKIPGYVYDLKQKPKLKFEELPIIFYEIEYKDGWHRNIERKGTILELLDTWDIDSPGENSEIAQVLRYLREFMMNGQIKSGE